MSSLKSIEEFISQKKIAVAGVSHKKQKFGNAIAKELKKKGYEVYPVNPNLDEFEGEKCYHSLNELPDDVTAIVISTKNETTLTLIEEAKNKGIKNIWLQQGSVDKPTLENIKPNGVNIISKECILMFAGDVKGVHGFHRWLKKSFGRFPS